MRLPCPQDSASATKYLLILELQAWMTLSELCNNVQMKQQKGKRVSLPLLRGHYTTAIVDRIGRRPSALLAEYLVWY